MNLLLIDNYDSFVYNIEQLIGGLGFTPRVVKNDQLLGIRGEDFDGIIISPGPGSPSIEEDRGEVDNFLKTVGDSKVLGICFGHQFLAYRKGSTVEKMDRQFHGEIDTMVHGESPLYKNIPKEFTAIRYHSLAVRNPQGIIPDCFSRSDGSIMGFHTADLRNFGVQFHPESFYSSYGKEILKNFLEV
ncbi:MAG: anthranilate synthase component II [Cuniculiplasma sp.]